MSPFVDAILKAKPFLPVHTGDLIGSAAEMDDEALIQRGFPDGKGFDLYASDLVKAQPDVGMGRALLAKDGVLIEGRGG